jgi:hypothetical protein
VQNDKKTQSTTEANTAEEKAQQPAAWATTKSKEDMAKAKVAAAAKAEATRLKAAAKAAAEQAEAAAKAAAEQAKVKEDNEAAIKIKALERGRNGRMAAAKMKEAKDNKDKEATARDKAKKARFAARDKAGRAREKERENEWIAAREKERIARENAREKEKNRIAANKKEKKLTLAQALARGVFKQGQGKKASGRGSGQGRRMSLAATSSAREARRLDNALHPSQQAVGSFVYTKGRSNSGGTPSRRRRARQSYRDRDDHTGGGHGTQKLKTKRLNRTYKRNKRARRGAIKKIILKHTKTTKFKTKKINRTFKRNN